MDIFKNWMIAIVVYSILSNTIMNLLPNASYKKYVKLFVGLVLIIVLISPILNLTDIESYFEVDFWKENFQLETKQVEEDEKEILLSAYKKQVETHIQEIAEEEGYFLEKCNAVLDEQGNVVKVDVKLSDKEKKSGVSVIEAIKVDISREGEEEGKELKQKLVDIYGISEEGICINGG